jgi:hypothetical protein
MRQTTLGVRECLDEAPPDRRRRHSIQRAGRAHFLPIAWQKIPLRYDIRLLDTDSVYVPNDRSDVFQVVRALDYGNEILAPVKADGVRSRA